MVTIQKNRHWIVRKVSICFVGTFWSLCAELNIIAKETVCFAEECWGKGIFFTIIPRTRAIVVCVRKKLLFMGRGPEMKRRVYKAFAKVVATISFKAETGNWKRAADWKLGACKLLPAHLHPLKKPQDSRKQCHVKEKNIAHPHSFVMLYCKALEKSRENL